ncbi:MAG: hypothetical protein ACOYJG_10665 [Prevotella sp.]|jgi:hypothetical protein
MTICACSSNVNNSGKKHNEAMAYNNNETTRSLHLTLPHNQKYSIRDYPVPISQIDSCFGDYKVRIKLINDSVELVKYDQGAMPESKDTIYFYGHKVMISIMQTHKPTSTIIINRNDVNKIARLKNIEWFDLGFPDIQKINKDSVICRFSLYEEDTDYQLIFHCIFTNNKFNIEYVDTPFADESY